MNKYRNIKARVDGIEFDSRKEANRYCELKLMERAKIISNLELQPKFQIRINATTVCTYIADFRYMDTDGKTVVEDVKGVKTAVYRLKKKLVKAVYEVDIVEV